MSDAQVMTNISNGQNKSQRYIVRLQDGVWLSDGHGDPCRTLNSNYARRFNSRTSAKRALLRVKKKYPRKGWRESGIEKFKWKY